MLSNAHSKFVMRNVFKFTALVTKRFVDLLEEKDPKTLCICGYFFMLTKKLESI